MDYQETYRNMLKCELKERKAINSSYSLRAFARDLGIEAPRLSMIMSAKKGMSVNTARKLLSTLSWSESEKESFVEMVSASHGRSKEERERAKERLKSIVRNENKLDNETFEVISDPLHYSIIELLKTAGFQSDEEWIAKRLGVSQSELYLALSRLIELGLISKKDGKYVVEDYVLSTPEHIPSNALKLHHSILIKKALLSVREQNIDERTLSSLVVAVPEELISEVFDKISSFRRDINHFIMANSSCDNSEVYCMTSQFFKLTKEVS